MISGCGNIGPFSSRRAHQRFLPGLPKHHHRMLKITFLHTLLLASTVPVAFAQNPPAAIVIDDDFHTGTHGWSGFFADYPPGVQDEWDFATGLRSLPAELNDVGTGFLLAGNNHSDDLAMLLKKQLGPADGLVPGLTYRVSFEIEFASDAADDAFGVGGSPGDSVYLKAGASMSEPLAPLNGGTDQHHRPNVNVGAQSTGGPAASPAGTIANGRDANLPPAYVSLTRAHAHSFLVQADAAGHLWLLVMTDSAFEGPTSLYYQRIRTTLTPVATGGETRLTNLSARALTEIADEALIAGVVVESPGAILLVRGVGPALADFDVSPVLLDPIVRLVRSTDGAVVASNDNWGDPGEGISTPENVANVAIAVGAFPLPAGSNDAALLVSVPAGSYTAIVEEASGSAALGLVEIYELTTGQTPNGRLLNLSTRAILQGETESIIAGLVVNGPSPERFLLRVVGPGLAEFGVDSPAVNPLLQLFRGDELITENLRWDFINDATEVAETTAQVGAFPLTAGSADAALVVTLEPGTYTLHASEVAPNALGVALVEVYRLP